MIWDALLYMYCFYWLMRKAAWAYDSVEYNQDERDIYIEREMAESERHHVAAEGDRCPGTLPVGHSLMAIHRIIEMG